MLYGPARLPELFPRRAFPLLSVLLRAALSCLIKPPSSGKLPIVVYQGIVPNFYEIPRTWRNVWFLWRILSETLKCNYFLILSTSLYIARLPNDLLGAQKKPFVGGWKWWFCLHNILVRPLIRGMYDLKIVNIFLGCFIWMVISAAWCDGGQETQAREMFASIIPPGYLPATKVLPKCHSSIFFYVRY